MWTNRVLMCGIDILLCLWAVYLFFFYFDIFFARKRKMVFVGDRYNAVRDLAIWNNNDY